jgi:hypothetical protein
MYLIAFWVVAEFLLGAYAIRDFSDVLKGVASGPAWPAPAANLPGHWRR